MTRDFPCGNYRFIPALFQYSSGVAADQDYKIEGVRFDELVPLADRFAQAATYMRAPAANLVLRVGVAFAGAAFTEYGFRRFNLHYVKTLAQGRI
jgi:hypothetical protein